MYPGLARAHYEGEYWPTHIEHCLDGKALDFVEQALYLRPLGPRVASFDVLSDTCIDETGARALCVLDRDDGSEAAVPGGGEPGIEFFTWSRRHIESYLLVPEAIRRSLRLGDDDGRLERAPRREAQTHRDGHPHGRSVEWYGVGV